jgi:excisionase family DNA binding protein
MDHKGKKAIYMSVTELAKTLGLSRVAIFKKIKKGQISAHMIGNHYAIPVEDVREMIGAAENNVLTEEKKGQIKKAIQKVVEEYGETLRLLGKE